MKYAKNLLEVIGNTPLVKLNAIAEGIDALVLAKLEYLNPGGSMKDRIGIAMIEDAEKKGLLKPGGTIVEPTSGNTGVGLAIAAAIKGYKLVCTMSEKMSMEKEQVLRAYGAEVVRAPADVEPDDPRMYINLAKSIAEERGGYYPNQYFNRANTEAHYKTTGPEIWRDTEGKMTHYVAPVGTGGTISGAARFLKEKNPNIIIFTRLKAKRRHTRSKGREKTLCPARLTWRALMKSLSLMTSSLSIRRENLSKKKAFLQAARVDSLYSVH